MFVALLACYGVCCSLSSKQTQHRDWKTIPLRRSKEGRFKLSDTHVDLIKPMGIYSIFKSVVEEYVREINRNKMVPTPVLSIN